MADNRYDLTRSDISALFERLDEILAERGQRVTVYVVGGANIALTVDGERTTTDVDTVVEHGFDHLAEAARIVAAETPGLGDDWINTEFTGGDNPTGGLFWQWFDNREDDEPRRLFDGAALTVEAASLEMMLALKTLGDREQDLADTYKLMRLTGIRTPEDIGRNLARFTGPRIFQVQGTDGIYPRIDPRFRRIFDNAPDDLRLPAAEFPARQRRWWRR